MRYSSQLALLNIVFMTVFVFAWFAGLWQVLSGQSFIESPVLFSSLCMVVLLSTFTVLFGSQWWVKRNLHSRVIDHYADGAYSVVIRILHEQASSLNLPKPVLHIYESDSLNAFIVGGVWRHQDLYMSRALVMQLSPDEIEAVIAHELAHIYHQDIVINEVFFGMGMACLYLLQQSFNRLLAYSGTREKYAEIAKKLAEALTYGCLLLPLWLMMLFYRRRSEYRADALASQLVGSQQFIWLLHRLKGVCRDSFFNLDEKQLLRHYFMTHPPLNHRITALEARQQA